MAGRVLPRRTVLVVDDDADLRILLSVLLGDPDLKVALAPDAASALALLAAEKVRIDVVLTDHMMPGATGLEVVRAAAGSIPTIVLTAYASPDVEMSYRQAGADEFFVKPFDVLALRACVRRLAGLDR